MGRVVSVWLKRWPIARLLLAEAKRSGPSDGPADAVDPARPFVVAAEASGGARIAALNRAAERAGLKVGGRLADARATVDGLQIRPADDAADAAALSRLALWATRYTPAVEPFDEASGADGLFLDIAGAEHLHGGEGPLLADLARRLSAFGPPARLALASTPGAAWALARFGASETVVPPGGEADALRPLPVAALRLPPQTVAALRRLGLKRIGDLLDAPRAPLTKRFGPDLLRCLDGALGRLPEPLTPVVPPPAYGAVRPFPDPVFTRDAIIAVATDLMAELAGPLARDGVGARAVRLGLYQVDGRAASLEIGLARPTRDANHVGRLLDLRLARTDEAGEPGFGFEAVRLDALAVEPLPERQGTLPASPNHRAGDRLAALVDVLRQRLGTQSARRLRPRESHIPERATAAGRVETGELPWPSPDDTPPRPVLLVRPPEPAEVLALVPEGPPRRFRWRGETHHVAHAQGPERIAAEWWCRRGPTRDYFLVEDEGAAASGCFGKVFTGARRLPRSGSSTACSRERRSHGRLRRACRHHELLLPARRLAPAGIRRPRRRPRPRRHRHRRPQHARRGRAGPRGGEEASGPEAPGRGAPRRDGRVRGRRLPDGPGGLRAALQAAQRGELEGQEGRVPDRLR